MTPHFSHFEQLASRYLKERGHAVLHRNYRTGRAEIDLVSQRGSVLYLIEVKYRHRTPPCLEEVIFAVQWRRIARAGAGLLSQHACAVELEMWLLLFTEGANEPRCYPIDLS